MLQRGSAVQLFNGFDTRQLKVSNDNAKNMAFDFQSVLSEKSYESNEVAKKDTQLKSDEKLNKHEMTSRKRPEVHEAKETAKEVKRSKAEGSKEVDNKSKVSESDESKESKELSAAKRLLKKLGMSDDEIENMLEMLPEDMIANLVQVVKELPQVMGVIESEGNLHASLTESVGNLQETLQEMIQYLTQTDSIEVSPELKMALENMTQKLESAQLNLENMKTEEFAQVVEAVQQNESSQAQTEAGMKTEVEIIDVKAIEPQSDISEIKVDGQAEAVQEVQTKTSEQGAADEDQESNTKDQPTLQTAAVESAEQSPSQVDQSAAEMIKIESAVIKNAQPMEHASGRVRLAQNIMNQVMTGVKPNLNLTENGQQIVLKLRPEELGTVDLKLSVEKGILMAEFNVESQIVKETLESNMADLKQALAEKGYNIEGMQVSVGQEQTEQQGQFENRFFNQNTQRKYFFGNEEDMPDFESINKTLAGLQSTFEYLG